MKNKISKTEQTHNVHNEVEGNQTVEVLYQKMGDRWFAFSLIDDEVFVGSIPVDEITQSEKGRGKSQKISGNS